MGTLKAFLNSGRLRQQKKRDRLSLSSAVPKIQWASKPFASTAKRLWKTCTFFLFLNGRKHEGVFNASLRAGWHSLVGLF